jgi:hypothetical protein
MMLSSSSRYTDRFLHEFGQQFKVELKGLEHKLKTRDSLRRKLVANAVKLLNDNRKWPNYTLDTVGVGHRRGDCAAAAGAAAAAARAAGDAAAARPAGDAAAALELLLR